MHTRRDRRNYVPLTSCRRGKRRVNHNMANEDREIRFIRLTSTRRGSASPMSPTAMAPRRKARASSASASCGPSPAPASSCPSPTWTRATWSRTCSRGRRLNTGFCGCSCGPPSWGCCCRGWPPGLGSSRAGTWLSCATTGQEKLHLVFQAG